MVTWFGIFSWCTLSLRVFHRDTKLGDGGASQEFFGSKNLIETFRRGKMDFFLANNSCRWIIKTFSCHAEVFLHFSENFYILGRRTWPRRGNFLNFFSPTTPGETWVEFFLAGILHLHKHCHTPEAHFWSPSALNLDTAMISRKKISPNALFSRNFPKIVSSDLLFDLSAII